MIAGYEALTYPRSRREALTKGIKDAIAATKLVRQQKRDAKKAEIDAIPNDVREALRHIRVVKFYPKSGTPLLPLPCCGLACLGKNIRNEKEGSCMPWKEYKE